MKKVFLIFSFCISVLFAANTGTEQISTTETNKTHITQKTTEKKVSQTNTSITTEAFFIKKLEFSTFCTQENLLNNPIRKFLNDYISWLKLLSVKNILLAIVAFLLYLFLFPIFYLIVAILLSLFGIRGGQGFYNFIAILLFLALPASDLYFNNPFAIIGIPFDIIITGIKLFLGIFGIYIENASILFIVAAIFVVALFVIYLILLFKEKAKIKRIVSSLKNIFYVIAMADGKLSKQEESYLKRIMYDFAKLANIDEELAKYITKEDANKASVENIKTYIKNLSAIFELDKNLKENLFNALVEFSLIDGLNEKKKEILVDIAEDLEIYIDDIEEYITHNFYQKKSNKNSNNSSKVDYYQILGIDKNANCGEIKKKYKELAKKYHPDKVASKDLDEEFIKFAEEMFKKINNAYEILNKIKGCKNG